jgi:hypothetical protein
MTTRRYDSFSKPEHQQLCLRVASVGCCFQFLQVVYGDHFRCPLRAGIWHVQRISRRATSRKEY